MDSTGAEGKHGIAVRMGWDVCGVLYARRDVAIAVEECAQGRGGGWRGGRGGGSGVMKEKVRHSKAVLIGWQVCVVLYGEGYGPGRSCASRRRGAP